MTPKSLKMLNTDTWKCRAIYRTCSDTLMLNISARLRKPRQSEGRHTKCILNLSLCHVVVLQLLILLHHMWSAVIAAGAVPPVGRSPPRVLFITCLGNDSIPGTQARENGRTRESAG